MAKRVSPRTPARRAVPPGAPARGWLLRTTALLPIAFGAAGAWGQSAIAPNAGPTGGQVVAGQASIATAPNRTTITQSTNRGVIDWQQFNVGSQHTVQFQQPNAGSWTLNRVVTSDPSVIAGRIQANGGVAIVNQSGIVFSQGAQVDVGSLIASAPGITNENFMAGRMRFDQAARPGARVENRGRIAVPDRGIAVLAGPRVTNSGEIHARLGRVVLAGAEAYALDLAGDGLLSIDITQAVRGDGAAVVTNEGVIEANGGSVLLTASAAGDLVEGLVRNTGRIAANTEAGRTGEVALRATGGGVEVTGTVTATGGAGQQGGRIALQSGESVRVATGAVLDASGGAGGGTVLVGTTGVGRNQTMARRTTVEHGATISADATVLGQGGTVAINSTEMTVVEGRLTARGGPQGGDGGLIELSGQGEMRLNATWDASAPAGQAGSLLLDPTRIVVTNNSAPSGGVPATGDETISANTTDGTLELRASELSASTGNIILEAAESILISTNVTKAVGNLTLRTLGTEASDSITIAAAVTLVTGSLTASTAGAFTITSAGSVTAGGNVSASAGTAISLAGDVSGANIGFSATGSIAQTAGSISTAGALTFQSNGAISQTGGTIAAGGLFAGGIPDGNGDPTAAASISLGQSGNAISAFGRIQASGDVTIHAGAGTLAITSTATVIGDDIRLTAIGGITQSAGSITAAGLLTLLSDGAVRQTTGGTITAGSLSVLGADGTTTRAASVNLNRSGNAIDAIAQIRATNDITIHAGAGASPVSVGAIASTSGDVVLSADRAVTLTGDVSGANIGFSATGSIAQTAGSISTAGALTFQSNGAISQTGGTIAAGGLFAGGIPDGNGDPTAAASISLGQSGNAINAFGRIQASGDVAIHVGSGPFTTAGSAIVSGDDVSLTAAGGITQSAGSITAAGLLTLLSDGVVSQTGGTITAGSLSVLGANGGTTSATSIDLNRSGNAIGAIAEVRATDDITINAGAGPLAISSGATVSGADVTLTAIGDITQTGGAITASGMLDLRSDGAVSQTGGTITAGSLSVRGTPDGIGEVTSASLGQSGNAIAALDQVLSLGDVTIHAGAGPLAIGSGASIGGADVTLIATGAITQTGGAINAGSGALTFRSDGAVGQAGGTVTAGSLSVLGAAGGTDRAASVSLGQSGNAIAAIGQIRVTGDITIHAGTGGDPLLIGAIATTAGNVVLSAARAVEVTGAISGVSLTLTGTTVTVGATGQATATGGDLILNATDVGGIIVASGSSLTGASGHRVVLRADALSLDAGATVTLTGTAVEVGPQTAGHAVLLGMSGPGLSVDTAALSQLTGSGATSLRFGETTIGANPPRRGGDLTLGTDLTFTTGDLTLVGLGAVALGNNAITTTGRDLGIHADGEVSGGGDLRAARLTILGATGSAAGAITLNGTNSAVGILDARSTGNIVLANTGGALTIRRADGASVTIDALGQALTLEAGGAGVAATGDVSLRAASVTLNAGIAAGNDRTLSLQTDGISGTGTLSVTGGTLEIGPATAGAALAIGASGFGAVIGAAQADTIIVGSSRFNGDTVTADNVTVSSAVTRTDIDLSFQAGGDFTANAAVTARNITIQAGGNIILDAAGTALSTGGTGQGTVSLTALNGDISQTANGLIITRTLNASAAAAGHSIDLSAGAANRENPTFWNQVARLGTVTADGSVVLNTSSALTITGAVQAANAIIAANGALTLDGSITASAATQLAAAGPITLNGIINTSGGTVTIGSSGAIAQTGGSITAGTFGASGTTIDLSGGTGNSLGALALRATTGDLAFDTDGTLTLAGTVNVAIIGGTDAFGGLAAAGNLSVSAGTIVGGSGTVFQAGADHSITLRADTLSLDSNTTIGAQGGGALASLSIGPRTGGRAMALGGTDAADNTLTLSDGTMARLLGVNTQLLQFGRTVVGAPVLAGDITVQSALGANGRLALAGSGNITLAQTLTTVTGDIELVAGGGISQTVAGGLAPGSGLLIASAGGDIDLRSGSNSFSALAAESSVGGIFVTSSAATLTTGSGSVTRLNGVVHTVAGISAATQVFLQAAAITIDAATPVIAGNLATPGSVTLRTDSVNILGLVEAPGGTVAIEPLTLAGPTIRLGDLDDSPFGTLSLNQAELALVDAATLVFGRSQAGVARDVVTSGDGTAWGSTLRLIGSGVAVTGPLSAGDLEAWIGSGGLSGAGLITTSSLIVRGLTGGADGGPVVLTLVGQGHRIDTLDILGAGVVALTLDAAAANQAIQVSQLRGASVNIDVRVGGLTTAIGSDIQATAGTVSLRASGAVDISGTIHATAGDLTIRGGSVALSNGITVNSGNVTIEATSGGATIGGAVSGRAVTVIGSGAVAIDGDVTATIGNVLIDAGQAMVLTNDVTAAGSVILRANSITQTTGVIGATGLVAEGRTGNVDLMGDNLVSTLHATAAGSLSVKSIAAGTLTVTQAAGTGSVILEAAALELTGAVGGAGAITVDLRTSGGVTQANTGIITAQTLTGTVTGDVALGDAANAVAEIGSFTFGGNFSLRASGTLTVTEALTATSGKAISLTAGGNLALQESLRADTVSLAATFGGISQTGGIIAAVTSGVRTSLDASGGAGVALDSAANDVGMLISGNGGSGGFLLRNNGDLTVTGLVQTGAGTTLSLDAAGTITLASGGSLGAAGATVALAADGAVTLAGAINAANAFITTDSALQQTAGGITTTGLLAVRAADINLQGSGNAIGQLAAEATAGNVAVTSTGTMTIGSGTPPGGTLITGVSGDTVFLLAGGLNVNQAVTAAPGNTVTLRADSMNIAAAVSASGGTVLLEQATPGRGISLGAENAAALSLFGSELAQVNANLLVIGRGSGQITVAGDTQAPASLPALRLLGSDIAVNALLAGPMGGLTQLQAMTGSITTAGSGRVAGHRLEASAAGNIALTGANDFAEVAGSAAGNFAYRDGNGFAVAAPGIQAGSVSLSTDAGNITQQAGAAIATGALDARAAAGSVLLDGGSANSAGADLNWVGAVTRLVASSGGLALLRNAHGFDMAGLADNGAGGMLGTLRLFAASGSITQSAGPLRVARLDAETPNGSLLLGQANGIATLGDIQVAGDLVVTNDGSLILAAPIDVGSFGGGVFGTAILTVNNGNLLQAAGARLSADRLIANALTGSVVLDGGGSTNPADLLRVGDLAGGYAGQSMVLRFGNAVTVTGPVQAGAIGGTPTGTLALEAPGITIGSPGQTGTLLRAGSVVLRTQADFDGPAIPGSGGIVQQGGAIEAVNLAASAPDGDVLLGLTSNRFNALAPGFSANGAASAHSLIAGGSIDIAEGGPGFIVLGGLQNAGGGIQLRSLGNLTFNAATGVSGPIDLSAAGTLTIATAADLRSDTLLTLNGGAGITVQGAVTAPDILASTGGNFSLTGSGRITGGGGAGGSVSVTAGHVETSGGIIAGYDIALQTGTGNIINTAFNAQNLVDIRAGAALRVAGIGVSADAMQARTSGLLTLAGGSYTIGSVVVFAGSAGIETEGSVQVRPRTGGLFPAIVLDSRAPGTQPDPLAVARPDVAGLAPDLQETQVRLPNLDAPGSFGAASSAPGGAIRFSLDAGQSPLFLLIDGGSATGTVNTSGRIGIHGRGGSVEITGTLIDPSGQRIEGQAAARMTDATRPATGAEISRFRINGCIVSSFNCVVPAQVIVVPTSAPVPPPLVYGGVGRDPDAVSPNVSEEWTVPGDEEEDDKR